MKIFARALAILLTAALLAGCASSKEPEDGVQSASGGVASAAEHINIKDITITTDGSDTVVTFSLLSGSRGSDYPESRIVSLPEYSVTLLPAPQRVMVTFQNVSFCDYADKGSWATSDFLLGLFQEAPADTNSVSIYLQLSRTAQFTVQEDEGDLILRLTPQTAETASRFYCVSNSFFEHQEGTWPKNIDMTPVLCTDMQNKMLISRPFDTRVDAEEYMGSVSIPLQSALPGNSLSIIELAPGVLPDYTDIDYSIADSKSVVMENGQGRTLPLLLQNGRYLATSPDGSIAFSRKYRPDDAALEQDAYLGAEQLWMLYDGGRVQNMNLPDFYSIGAAQFSADGRYLCLQDISIENSILYVYDFDTGNFWNLGEEGFGNQTSAFAWSDAENILYAMTGNEDSIQMQSCSFLAGDSLQIGAVEEEPGAVGHVGASQGRIYFADSYAGTIYEVGETRTELTSGMDFRLSPDGSLMVVLETSLMQDEQVLTNLKRYDIVTGKSSVIASDLEIASFDFSPGGETVYYTVEDDGTAGYPFSLYAYDVASGENSLIAQCSSGDIAVSPSGVLYLIQFFDGVQNSFYATYQYDLGQ